jgi:hypothetical protein
MPQARAELAEVWDQSLALIEISKNFNDRQGWISKKDPQYTMTDKEADAIEYLCDEWDYAYE